MSLLVGESASISGPAPLWSLIYPCDSSRTMGRARQSQTACGLEFSAPLVRPMRCGPLPLQQACGRPVRLQTRVVDDDALGRASLPGQCGEDPQEDTIAGLTDVAVIECLVRAIDCRGIAPA